MRLTILFFAGLCLLDLYVVLLALGDPDFPLDSASTVESLIGVAIRCFVMIWLITNRELFERRPWTNPEIIEEQLKSPL